MACLDMAGTTVRDDGAVEAAFTTALAAVGIAVGTPRFEEAEAVVRRTMGWSKADVFATLLEPAAAGEATAAFAAAYEAIVAAGGMSEIPGALQVLRELRAAGYDCGDIEVPVADDLTENQIKAFRLLANQSSSWAEWDMPLLKIELEGLKLADYPLELTGFEQVQLVSFLSGISDPNAEWRGMPEFDQKDKSAFRTIPVHFKDQVAIDKFAKLLKAKITEDTRYLWFPEIEIETYADKRYKGKKWIPRSRSTSSPKADGKVV